MEKSLRNLQLSGFVFTSVAGVLLHFLYEWTGQSIAVASFSAVNESIWEHMKLLFFPMFVFALVESEYAAKAYKNFWCVKLIGIVLGTALIPVLYYTINGAFGKTPDWVNVVIFFVAVAVTYLAETWLMQKGNIACKYPEGALSVLSLIALMFVIFTFATPRLPLFRDPLTRTYGYCMLM